jgi:phosphoglycolate phosphatase
MANITAVFDLDGTVADTAADLIVAANAALASEDWVRHPPRRSRKAWDTGAKAMLQSAIASLGQNPKREQLSRLSIRLVAYYEKTLPRHEAVSGFGEAAASLRDAGVKLALCTNKRER